MSGYVLFAVVAGFIALKTQDMASWPWDFFYTVAGCAIIFLSVWFEEWWDRKKHSVYSKDMDLY